MTAALIPAIIMGGCAAWTALDANEARAMVRGAIASALAFGAAIMLAIASAFGLPVADPVALATLLLTGFIGAIVNGFALRYMRADPARRRYAATVSLLLAAVMLFAAAGDVVSLALGWIVSGWALAALIGHRRDWDAARAARQTALASFAVGDLALIAALVLYTSRNGSIALPGVDVDGPTATAIAALLLVAAMARCASPPFHRWLGRSITAPTPVSALMHAGFVNGGGVLLIRFAPVLESVPVIRAAAVAVGLMTALVGTAIMLVRPDIKRSLAGSTVAQMGFMLMSCGLGAYAAALWHLIAHGLFKAWLFLRSGSAIGIGVVATTPGPRAGTIGLVGLAGIAAAGLIALAGLPQTAVPLALVLVSITVSLPGLVARPSLVPVGLTAAASYALGLSAVERLLPHPLAAPLGKGVLPVALLPMLIVAIFAGGWLVQALVAGGRLRLPAALHARLLTA